MHHYNSTRKSAPVLFSMTTAVNVKSTAPIRSQDTGVNANSFIIYFMASVTNVHVCTTQNRDPAIDVGVNSEICEQFNSYIKSQIQCLFNEPVPFYTLWSIFHPSLEGRTNREKKAVPLIARLRWMSKVCHTNIIYVLVLSFPPILIIHPTEVNLK